MDSVFYRRCFIASSLVGCHPACPDAGREVIRSGWPKDLSFTFHTTLPDGAAKTFPIQQSLLFVAFGGSPRIHAGEERFSTPKEVLNLIVRFSAGSP
jgi:hypothetical protein